MKCRRGLWSPSRSQRLSGHNNHTFCHSIFYLPYSLLSYFCLHHSITLFLTVFHHLRHFSGSCSPSITFLHFNLHCLFFLPLPYSDFLSASSFPIYLAACHYISVSVGPLFFEVIIPHSGKHSYLHSCQNLEIDTALMSAC